MIGIASPAVPLLANIRISEPDKLALFRSTIADAAAIFSEAHLKVRGRFADEAIAFARTLPFSALHTYQQLQEEDWIAATLEMLQAVRARSIFLYFEDHRLLAPAGALQAVIADFDTLSLDCLGYSFFRAARLSERNLLPFGPIRTAQLAVLDLDADSLRLLGQVSPGFYSFSLMSIVSVEYFRGLLADENGARKLYARRLSTLLSILFRYPGYRKVVRRANGLLRHLDARICYYHPSSPFNLERMWWESHLPKGRIRLGVCAQELFANCDDDNGADGESLVKRGLYPDSTLTSLRLEDAGPRVTRSVRLEAGERLDLWYHSAHARIRTPPVVFIDVTAGQAQLVCRDGETTLKTGDRQAVYANKESAVIAQQTTTVQLHICDECFS